MAEESGHDDGPGQVVAVSTCAAHVFSKQPTDGVSLLAGLGVEGDVHAGVKVLHRARLRSRAAEPNLRQVHLIHSELLDELRGKGFDVAPGDLGENVTTSGVDLLGLPTGARLLLGEEAVVEVTGLRHPCRQLDRFRRGLMAAVMDRDDQGGLVRKVGVMAVVVTGGRVAAGDAVQVRLPAGDHRPLEPV
jgi:hypothetical protein